MTIDHLAVIASESALVVEALRRGPLDAAVPGCPDWDLGQLGVHMVDVQRWATHIVRTGVLGEPDVEPPDSEDAADALEASSAALLATLKATDPNAPCWNFSSAPQTMQFWFRRQALEVAVHRFDAQVAAAGDATPLDPIVAADVIDEFIRVSLQRVVERENIDLTTIRGDVHIHCTDLAGLDAPGEWTFEAIDGELVVSAEHRKSAVALRGSASDLALALYGRTALDSLEVFGDTGVLDQWSAVLAY